MYEASRRRQPQLGNSLALVPIACFAVLLVALHIIRSPPRAPLLNKNWETRQVQEPGPQSRASFATSTQRMQEIHQYVYSSAGVYGQVQKKSIIPPELWSGAGQYHRAKSKRVKAWITQHEINNQPIVEPVVPVSCGLYINHEYRIVFVRQLKSASTSFMHFFGNCKIRKDTPTCLTGIPANASPEKIIQNLRNYTVFTLVRNPYTRAASGYSFLNNVVRSDFATQQALEDPACNVEWTTYCKNPRILARHCRENPHCCGDEETGHKMNLNVLMLHTDPQSPCIRGSDGTWAVDFIARSEHSDEDIVKLVELINHRRPQGIDPIDVRELQRANVQSCDAASTSVTKVVSESDANSEPYGEEGEAVQCDLTAKYLQYYQNHQECFDSISNYFREDIKFLKYGEKQQPAESQPMV